MAKRPRNVDLGPMYMQVGEEDASSGHGSSLPPADPNSVARFQALMHRKRHDTPPAPHTPETLDAPATWDGLPGFGDPDDLGAEIAHLWTGTGMQSEREVRMGLREALLPGTSVRLLEAGGRLRIEFTCAARTTAEWLGRRLPALSRALGQRLNRSISVAVYTTSGVLTDACEWPETDAT